jgi:hypothetical protein
MQKARLCERPKGSHGRDHSLSTLSAERMAKPHMDDFGLFQIAYQFGICSAVADHGDNSVAIGVVLIFGETIPTDTVTADRVPLAIQDISEAFAPTPKGCSINWQSLLFLRAPHSCRP